MYIYITQYMLLLLHTRTILLAFYITYLSVYSILYYIQYIGGICKGDLKKMMLWAADKYTLPILTDIVNAVPTVSLPSPHLTSPSPYISSYTPSLPLFSPYFIYLRLNICYFCLIFALIFGLFSS